MKRCLALSLLTLALPASAEGWRQFRGNDSTGVAADAVLPARFKPDRDVAWKAPLPGRGQSSPVVVGDRVFVTYAGDPLKDRLGVLAFDARTGKQLWNRSFWGTGPTHCHPKTCMAAPTPASDGKTLIALFATSDVVALDLDGNVRWVRCLNEEHPGVTDGRGMASSPLIVGDAAVVFLENQNVSFAVGIDLASGADRWRVDRPRQPCWTSPLLIPGPRADEPLVLLQGTSRLSALDPRTGAEAWHLDRESNPIASAVLAGTTLYVPDGQGLAAFALRPGGPPKSLWHEKALAMDMASPVVVGGRVYCLNGGILVGADAKTGQGVRKLRLKGPFSASPVAAGDRLCCVSEDGLLQFVNVAPDREALAGSGPLGETILATPALAGGALFVRSDKHLWKITNGGGARP
jgi:outer membrane protein assembly factor BamB